MYKKWFTPTPILKKLGMLFVNLNFFSLPIYQTGKPVGIGVSLRSKRGFTLIELLVVIAIIGILSSIILTSLNSARGKGANAAVRAGLMNLRSQATIFFDDNNQSYAGVCNNADILLMLENASSSGNGMSGCASDAESWSAYARFKVQEGANEYWCIDSSGFSNAMATFTEPWTTSSCQ